MAELFPRIEFPELVFGFVSPIGTPLEKTIGHFRTFFAANNYYVHEVKVTDVFDRLRHHVPVDTKHPLVKDRFLPRVHSFIRYGNKVRAKLKDDSILAGLAIQQIVEKRNALAKAAKKYASESPDVFQRNVFLIHQFKRPEEIALLRSVYGRLFFQVSIYSDRPSRVDYICRRIASGDNEADHRKYEAEALKLIQTDENEENVDHGQRVGRIFHDADVIFSLNADTPLDNQVGRFCELLFSSNAYTPTRLEHGMFVAKSAALRTADLSRQVGAAVFSSHGDIVAIGCNEVPKAKGGTYWPEDEPKDDREFRRGEDSNDVRKTELLQDLIGRLGLKSDDLTPKQKKALKKASLMDALEYGRIVHAEMAAITDAARNIGGLKNATLYTTTFPCHMCAKHVVASGISEVYFLEPYPKSLTSRLHDDSVEIESKERGPYKDFHSVRFRHFFGVTPRRYADLFSRAKRKKDTGKFEEYISGIKRPNVDTIAIPYIDFEHAVLEHIKNRAGI